MGRLQTATKEEQDDEIFVEECIEEFGPSEFAFASKRLREDARFIYHLIEKHPEVLQHAENQIHERFTDRFGRFVDNSQGKNLMFTLCCCAKNINVYKYLDEEWAEEYYTRVKDGFVVKGMFLGDNITWFVALDETDNLLKELTSLRPEITEKIESELLQT